MAAKSTGKPDPKWEKWLGGTTVLREVAPSRKPVKVRRPCRREMDEPCVALCTALNRIKGIQTESSCCGHGEDVFDIWLYADAIRPLHLVARAIDPRYGAPGGWKLETHDTDLEERPVMFRLASRSKGVNAFVEAAKIAALIEEHLAWPDYCAAFGIESATRTTTAGRTET